MNRIAIWGGIGMVVLGAAWIQAEIRRAEARGAALESADRADEADAALADSTAAYRGREAAASEQIQTLTTNLDRMNGLVRRTTRSARREAGRADSVLVILAADAVTHEDSSALALVAGALDTLQTSLDVCGTALATCDSLRTALQLRILDGANLIAQHEATNLEQSRAIQALRSVRAPPRPLVGTRDVIEIVLGLVAGYYLASR